MKTGATTDAAITPVVLKHTNRMKEYSDKYKMVVTAEKCVTLGEKSYREVNITIEELHGYGGIIFKTPLKITGVIPLDPKDTLWYTYDFGMSCGINLGRENFLYEYAGPNKERDPMKTLFATIKFDLMHAFHHCELDPNYTHLHWALAGNLRDRVTVFDYEEGDKFQETVVALVHE